MRTIDMIRMSFFCIMCIIAYNIYMIKILENVSLKPYSTMRTGGYAQYFAIVKSDTEMVDIIKFYSNSDVNSMVNDFLSWDTSKPLLGRCSYIPFKNKNFTKLVETK